MELTAVADKKVKNNLETIKEEGEEHENNDGDAFMDDDDDDDACDDDIDLHLSDVSSFKLRSEMIDAYNDDDKSDECAHDDVLESIKKQRTDVYDLYDYDSEFHFGPKCGAHISRDEISGQQLVSEQPYQYSVDFLWTFQRKHVGVCSGLNEGLDPNQINDIFDEMQFGKDFVIDKRLRSILNKINGENFDKLSHEIADIITECVSIEEPECNAIDSGNDSIDDSTEEDYDVATESDVNRAETERHNRLKQALKIILSSILEKSINELLYSSVYARLCYSLYLYKNNDERFQKMYRTQLLTLSHQLFQKYYRDRTKYKQQLIGLLCMIGELHHYGVIGWKVISAGIFDVMLNKESLSAISAVDIEALCKLLKTSGDEFDKRHKKTVEGYIERMKQAVESNQFEFRIRCMVEELVQNRQKKQTKALSNTNTTDIGLKTSASSQSNHASASHQYAPYQAHQSYNNQSYNYHHRTHHNHTNYPSQRHQQRRRGPNKPHHSHSHHSHRAHSKNRSNALKPTVEFVKDVSISDRSHHKKNIVLNKTWRMRNSGELPWGDDVELVYFKGDASLTQKLRYPVMNALPGQEVDIDAVIQTPGECGRYCTYFRLQKNGKFFGPRVWCDIIVVD
jgi:hypothetical protein